MRNKGAAAIFAVVLAVLVYGAYIWGAPPHLFLTAGNDHFDLGHSPAGTALTLHYRHSVQQTHVWEYLTVDKTAQGFILSGTKYRSYGVGLPFLPTEGTYRSDGEFFYLENMHRPYSELHLRIGVGTEVTVTANGQEYALYQNYPPGTAVSIRVLPFWQGYLQNITNIRLVRR